MEPYQRRVLARLRSKKGAAILSVLILLLFLHSFQYTLTTNTFTEERSPTTVTITNGTADNTTTTPSLRIVNPYPYHFTVLPSPCVDEELVFVIHSAVGYHKRRMLMRNTWLNKQSLESALNHKVKIVFVTGATNNTMTQAYLQYEHEMYGDIIQSSFIDDYQNNTLKAISYLRWVTSSYGCPNSSLIIKVDDDALIHPVKLGKFNETVHKLLNKGHKDLYAGRLITKRVNRDNSSKWYMPRELWPDDLYPTWFQGLVYFLTPHLAAKLYPIALSTTYLFTDDVYIGILVNQVPEAEVIIDNNISAHVEKNVEKELTETFRAGSQLFYHVPDFRIFFMWYYREDIRPMKSRLKTKPKVSVWVVIIILFPLLLFFLLLCVCVIYFYDPDQDGGYTTANNKS